MDVDVQQILANGMIWIDWIAHWPVVVFLKWFLIVYCVVLLVDIILLLSVHGLKDDARKSRYGSSERPLRSPGSLRREWSAIMARLRKNDPNEYKIAILEADQFMDRVLAEIGYPGANLQERLDAMASVSFESVDQSEYIAASLLGTMIAGGGEAEVPLILKCPEGQGQGVEPGARAVRRTIVHQHTFPFESRRQRAWQCRHKRPRQIEAVEKRGDDGKMHGAQEISPGERGSGRNHKGGLASPGDKIFRPQSDNNVSR